MPEASPLTPNVAFRHKLWSARFLKNLDRMYTFKDKLNTNYSAEGSQAREVVLPQMTQNITVGDYTAGTDIVTQATEGAVQTLTLDQQKYFSFYIDDVSRVQNKPELMDEAMRLSAQRVAEVKDTYYAGILQDAVPAANLKIESSHVATSAVNQAMVDSAANTSFGYNFVKKVQEIGTEMTALNLPMADRWVIIHPDQKYALERYFSQPNIESRFAELQDIQANGYAGKLGGFKVYCTPYTKVLSIMVDADGELDTDSGTAADHFTSLFGQGNSVGTRASQIDQMESFRSPVKFGDQVRGLYVYGGRIVHPKRIWSIASQGIILTPGADIDRNA